MTAGRTPADRLGTRRSSPTSSRDGSLVAFAAPGRRRGDRPLDGPLAREARPPASRDTPACAERLPVWSPAGHHPPLRGRPPEQLQRPAVDASTSPPVSGLSRRRRHSTHQAPDWSPDGRGHRLQRRRRHLADGADGTGQVHLTGTPSVDEFGAAFSPDGCRSPSPGRAGRCPRVSAYDEVMGPTAPPACRRRPTVWRCGGAPGHRPGRRTMTARIGAATCSGLGCGTLVFPRGAARRPATRSWSPPPSRRPSTRPIRATRSSCPPAPTPRPST